MPHLNLEYSNNLDTFDVELALQQLNEVLVQSGHFLEEDIQSRAIGFTHFRIGKQAEGRAFVHIKLHMLSGRSAEVKKILSQALIKAITVNNPHQLKISVRCEIIDIDRDSYEKINLG